MKYLLIAMTVVAIQQISCSESQQITPEPFNCTFKLTDIDNVVNRFYENKNTSKSAVTKIINTEKELYGRAACEQPNSEVPCSEVSISNASALQFDRYYGGNERAFVFMTFEVQRIFVLTSQENSDSQCACEVKGRAIDAMNKCGYGIIHYTDSNVYDVLMPALENMELPECTKHTDREFFTKYKVNRLYSSAEGDLRKCKTKNIKEFFAEVELINDELKTCVTKTTCSKF